MKEKITWIKEQHDHLGTDPVEAEAAYAAVKHARQVPSRGGIAWLKHFSSPPYLYAPRPFRLPHLAGPSTPPSASLGAAARGGFGLTGMRLIWVPGRQRLIRPLYRLGLSNGLTLPRLRLSSGGRLSRP